MYAKGFRIGMGVIISICVLVLAGCGDSSSTPTIPATIPPTSAIASTTSPSPNPAQDWQAHWLKNIPCRLPCWEGLNLPQLDVQETL
ncbi:MAG: hypothetical protein HXX08_23120 [Chloroflexi bacterium]|uniref:Uncharacterized protein n=1 Tax=Candidatus Chlorohelix allophototropha TaxID=3003348 RepID=A0A8T7M9P5_9CHLR|nr:hypothetical protein [Chloroflexota bacterium]WJW68696.1 hypothetical protein OZ401_004312 [Chloroflexota bacterium L227-S17]